MLVLFFILSNVVVFGLYSEKMLSLTRAFIEVKKPESAHVHHSWVRNLALIPCSVAAANLLSVQLDLSIQLSISLSIQL